MSTTLSGTRYLADDVVEPGNSAAVSGVSWAAVFAGGVTAAAISAILVIFGAGLGLASVSPWAGAGVSVTTFTVLAAIWMVITQWVSSLFGGYMAGRLRTKWVNVHTDEVFFRDTAHGFLAWALGTLITVGLFTSISTMAAGTGAHAAAQAASNATADNYYVDLLFRQNAGATTADANGAAAGDGGSVLGAPPVTPPAPQISDADMREQAATILAQGAANGGVSDADAGYLTQLVAQRTGLAPADAQARVNDVLADEQAAEAKARQIADDARKATSGALIYTFVSLLIGAFIASVAGAVGGRLRDGY
jgi:hypothetical protein